MNERLREIIQNAGIVDIPAGRIDLADQVYEFRATKQWLRQILAAPILSISGHVQKSVDSLSVRFLDGCNQKMQQLLSAGFCPVYIDGDVYQILDPSRQILIRFQRHEFHEQKNFPQNLPAIHGQLDAKIEAAEGTNYAYFTVSCGRLGVTSQFSRIDVIRSPTLYAVATRQDRFPSLLIFGQLNKNRFVRSKQAA